MDDEERAEAGRAAGSGESVVAGVVVRGDGRGRELGFPTANVSIADVSVLPPDGIYAGWLERADGSRHVAAVSVGTRPTYYDGDGAERLVEAYLLDFDDDLYGETVQVAVGERVRGQVRFGSDEELIDQMTRDVAAVRHLAAGRGA